VTATEPSLREIGVKRQRTVISRKRLLVPPERTEGVAAAKPRFRKTGVYGKRAFESSERLIPRLSSSRDFPLFWNASA